MAIKFFNVKTGEKRTVDTEPAIAAFYNSSDQHANAMQGQDFGWRIAPETVKRIRELKSDQQIMDRIAQAFQLPQGEVGDTDVLRWISLEDARKEVSQTEQVQGNFEKEYQEELRALEGPSAKTTTPQKPKADVKVSRSAKDGQFVTEEEAKASPDTTVTETVKSDTKK